MDGPANFEVHDGYAVLRPAAVRTVRCTEGARLVVQAIELALERKVKNLLVNAVGLDYTEMPSIPDRYFFVREWADAACGKVRIAVVLEPHLIDPQPFGPTVAANRGLSLNLFASEEAALEWLLVPAPKARASQTE